MKTLWKPNPGQQEYALSINSDTFEILYGGARGGGKTDCGIIWLLKNTHHPNFTGLVIRKNHSDLRQWCQRALELWPQAKMTGKPAIFTFPSGAKIYTGHLKDKEAYTQFQGWEIQALNIEECGQIPDEESYLKLLSSCRSTIDDLKPQVFASANPGNVGHNWLKKRWKIGEKKPNVAFKDPVSGRYRIYIPSTISDNPVLCDKDPEYVRYLESLPEPLRSAWRYGDWDIFAGQYFKDWNPAVHIQDEKDAKKLGFGSEYNNKFIGIDWGFSAPTAVIWLEVTPENRVFAYRELYVREKHPMEIGEMIYKMSEGEEIVQTLADPSMWIRNPISWRKEETQMYSDNSIAHSMVGNYSKPLVTNMVPANNDRVNGWRNISQLMAFSEKKKPNFYVIKNTCPNLLRTIPEMICDEKRPEDLDTTLEDHACDALRYGLSSVQIPDYRQKKSKDQIKYESLLGPSIDDTSHYNFND